MGNYSRHDSPVLDFRPYMRVLISAVGWPGDPGVKAHPRRTWLELYLQEVRDLGFFFFFVDCVGLGRV